MTTKAKEFAPDTTILGQDTTKDLIATAIKLDIPTLLIGDTGTGKTSIIREKALTDKKSIIRFNMTGETTIDEFVGKYELENGALLSGVMVCYYRLSRKDSGW